MDEPIGCGHSCVVAKPKGMAPNGACHCIDGLDVEQRRRVRAAFIWYRSEIGALRTRLAAVEAERDGLREALAAETSNANAYAHERDLYARAVGRIEAAAGIAGNHAIEVTVEAVAALRADRDAALARAREVEELVDAVATYMHEPESYQTSEMRDAAATALARLAELAKGAR